ncbi:ATP-binding protein [Streptomyces phaeochromogenes]|uniref:ATP-binding protein n=1 Tax=Streptomyces phaeochromogenes TaxID=1923 RepID=UPI0036754DBB
MPTVTSAPTAPSASFRFLPCLGFDVVFARSSGSGGGVIAEEDRLWPRIIRHDVRAVLSRWRRPDLTENAELLVCELVTNALEHGRGDVGVRLYFATNSVRIEVRDGSHHTPTPRTADPWDEDGRGLLIVQSLATAWGVSRDGTMTWCSLTF